MTVEAFPTPISTPVSGVGPYDFAFPVMAASDVRVQIALLTGQQNTLSQSDYTVALSPLTDGGNITLTAPIAAEYAGRSLTVTRNTLVEQGWEGLQGAREAGLETQLDRLTMAAQEAQIDVSRSLRLTAPIAPMVPQAGRVIVFDDNLNPVPGPSTSQIVNANNDALRAEAAADRAEAAENSLLVFRGGWVTNTAYKPSDIVRHLGSSWICVVPHTSGVFSNDAASSIQGVPPNLTVIPAKWQILAEKGAAGDGAGDMLRSANLSDVLDVAAARTNLGLVSVAATGAYADLSGAPAALTPEQAADPADPVFGTVNGQILSHAIFSKSLGWEQAWQNLTASRANNTAYQNTTGRPIAVSIRSPNFIIQASVNGSTWIDIAGHNTSANQSLSALIPNGHYYRTQLMVGAFTWAELR